MLGVDMVIDDKEYTVSVLPVIALQGVEKIWAYMGHHGNTLLLFFYIREISCIWKSFSMQESCGLQQQKSRV